MKTKIICLLALLLVAGCAQVVVKDANDVERFKANVFAWDFNFDEIAYKEWLISRFDGKANKVKVITPAVYVETESAK